MSPMGSSAPVLDPQRGLLHLPPTAEAWDLRLGNDATVVTAFPATYELDATIDVRVRRLREGKWARPEVGSLDARTGHVRRLVVPELPESQAMVTTDRPSGHYRAGQPIVFNVVPNQAGFREVRIQGEGAVHRVVGADPQVRFSGELSPGRYRVRARWLPDAAGDGAVRRWTRWSRVYHLDIHERAGRELRERRAKGFRVELLVERDVNGLTILTDPYELPPEAEGCDEPGAWFRHPVFEGATSLINEERDYYANPLKYYLECIRALRDRGVEFRTWGDLLDDPAPRAETELLLQLDVDGGPKSFRRLADELVALGVRASAAVHRSSNHWYRYEVEDIGFEFLRELEVAGWTIGYHNDAVTNELGEERGPASEQVLARASQRFAEDVRAMREHLDVRVYTHHGGNAGNNRVAVPEALGLVGVDRRDAPELWSAIDRRFSDGGFLSAPSSLRVWTTSLGPGRHFMRSHPLKYANFVDQFDVPPLVADDARRRGFEVTPELEAHIAENTARMWRWLEQRDAYMGWRPGGSHPRKPLTRNFTPRKEIEPKIDVHYRNRTSVFKRMYPWKWGDPRVLWWQVLDAYSSSITGRVLNVGALPEQRRAETTDFLAPDVEVVEIDIDPARKPHLLGDITRVSERLDGTFDAVLLFALGAFHSPSLVVATVRRLLKSGGIALFGFTADSHPSRGGLWRPFDRPIWRAEREPLGKIGLRGSLWSFDEQAVQTLFGDWPGAEYEYHGSGMYYVVAPGA